MTAQQDAEFFSGNDVVFDCAFTDESTGQPMDLSGAQALTYSLAKSEKSAQALITKQLGSGVVTVNPVQGTALVTLSAADTEPLSGKYYHEIRLVNATGKKLTLMFGTVNIKTNLIRD